MDRAILRKWLKAGVIEQDAYYLTTAGTPQGGIISPALMNLTLDGLEQLLDERFPRHKGKLVNFVRYADDCARRKPLFLWDERSPPRECLNSPE